MANIYDVAREAGVSKSTVSRVINNQSSVKDDTKQKVLDAMNKLHYKPNSAARNLVLKRKNTIGVFISELADDFYSVYLHDIQHILNTRYNYGALYCNMNDNVSAHVDYLQILNKNVDGYIFVGENTISEKDLNSLIKSGENVATIGIGTRYEGTISAEANNEEAAYNAVKYLIKLGHKNILHLSFIKKKVEFSLREQGYRRAMTESGLENQVVDYIGYDYEEAFRYGTKLARDICNIMKENRITAAFCGNDIVATGLIDALQCEGVKVPNEFSVVGFDDIVRVHKTKTHIPPLTTLRQPQNEMTEYAIERLYNKIYSEKEASYKVFNCDLVVRSTTSEPM